MPETRVCSTCRESLPLETFSPDKSRVGGLQRQCRRCRAAYMRAYNARHRERERLRATLARWGITVEQYEALVAAAGGLCAVCQQPPRESKALCIDHDHVTGVVRGLLCQDCNLGIGQLRDDPELLDRAAAYLRAGSVLPEALAFTVDPTTHGSRRTDIRRRARLARV